MQDLKLKLIQTSLYWGDKKKNLEMLSGKIGGSDGTDIIILPEMFNTGFMTDPVPYGEPLEGPTLEWMLDEAGKTGSVVCGSFIVEEDGNYYNRLLWVRPDGTYEHYDKRHLFRMAGEHEKFSMGRRKIITEHKGWKISPLVCYDLRFPVWSRNRYLDGTYEYDLLIYIANWPEVRSLAWRALLPARAVENLCVVAGVNRVGTDGNGKEHSGDSAVIGPDGTLLHQCEPHQEKTARVTLSARDLQEFRARFQAGKDWDSFTVL